MQTIENLFEPQAPTVPKSLNVPKTEFNIEDEYSQNIVNLKIDIEHIDQRMKHISQYIATLENQISSVKTIINNTNNIQKKVDYYTVMNTCIELNARYEELYLKCVDIKFKYRKEQDDLIHKVKRFHYIDLPKSKIDAAKTSEMTVSKLTQLMADLSRKIDNTDKETTKVIQTISDLDTNPEYRL